MKKKVTLKGNVNFGGFYATAVFIPEGQLTEHVGRELISEFRSSFGKKNTLSGHVGNAIHRELNVFFLSGNFVLQVQYTLMPAVTIAPGHLQAYIEISRSDSENLIDQMETLLGAFDK